MSLLVVGLSGLCVVAVGVRALSHQPARIATSQVVNKHVAALAPKDTGPGWPVRLRIPKLSINAALDYVGITATGQLDAPKLPGNAGWYYQGVRPGAKGSAVIDGHYGWKDNLPAVFDDLHTLQVGDEIFVDDERGAPSKFIVREVRSYGESDDAKEVFHSDDGKAHLNLITCEGSWSNARKSYSNRLVVFADKE